MLSLRKVEKYSNKLTNFEAFTSTFKALVGIGILSCPLGYASVGLIIGITGNILILVICLIMYWQLMKVVEKYSDDECKSIGDVCERVLG